MKKEKVIEEVFKELREAEEKHPYWPKDIIHQAAIVAEEAGEMLKECNNLGFFEYKGKEKDQKQRVKEEAIQTAAMALRFLFNFVDNKEADHADD